MRVLVLLLALIAPTAPTMPKVMPGSALPTRHAYFDFLTQSTWHVESRSLRNAAQVSALVAQQGKSPGEMAYIFPNDPDPRRQDAMRILFPRVSGFTSGNWPLSFDSAEQARIPLKMAVKRGEGSDHLFVWDAWKGAEFAGDPMATHKEFQFAGTNICHEIRSRYSLAARPNIATVDVRTYPGGNCLGKGNGPNVTLDTPLAPQLAVFVVKPETWTRYIVRFETSDPNYVLFSMWLADAKTNPVQLFNRLQVGIGELRSFWFEFNTSNNCNASTPCTHNGLTAYVRNWVHLRNATLSAVLQKP